MIGRAGLAPYPDPLRRQRRCAGAPMRGALVQPSFCAAVCRCGLFALAPARSLAAQIAPPHDHIRSSSCRSDVTTHTRRVVYVNAPTANPLDRYSRNRIDADVMPDRMRHESAGTLCLPQCIRHPRPLDHTRSAQPLMETCIMRSQMRSESVLYYAMIFLIIALAAGILGFTGAAGAAVGIAKFLFFVFLVLFAAAFVYSRRGRH